MAAAARLAAGAASGQEGEEGRRPQRASSGRPPASGDGAQAGPAAASGSRPVGHGGWPASQDARRRKAAGPSAQSRARPAGGAVRALPPLPPHRLPSEPAGRPARSRPRRAVAAQAAGHGAPTDPRMDARIRRARLPVRHAPRRPFVERQARKRRRRPCPPRRGAGADLRRGAAPFTAPACGGTSAPAREIGPGLLPQGGGAGRRPFCATAAGGSAARRRAPAGAAAPRLLLRAAGAAA